MTPLFSVEDVDSTLFPTEEEGVKEPLPSPLGNSNQKDGSVDRQNFYEEGSYDSLCQEFDSYIPLPHQTKQAIVWGFKSISLALSTAYLIAEFSYPVAPVDPTTGKGYAFPLFQGWCHNIHSRTFQYSNGHYMPLCARCTGLNCGIFLGHFDSFIWDSFSIKGWERWQQGLLHMGSYSLLTLPLLVDGFVQAFTPYESNNGWRFVTGVLFSYALTAIADELLQLTWDYAGDIHPASKQKSIKMTKLEK